MKAKALLIALVLAATPALADNCTDAMGVIDQALPNVKQRSAADRNEIKRLRVEGDKLHTQGKHPESIAALGRAKKMLGIK